MNLKGGKRSLCGRKGGLSAGKPRSRNRISVTVNPIELKVDDSAEVVVEPPDPYKELRYSENAGLETPVVWSYDTCMYQTRPVLVRKKRTTPLKRKPPPIDPSSLRVMLPVGKPDESLEVYSRETSMLWRKTEALQKEVSRDMAAQGYREQVMAIQEDSLRSWDGGCKLARLSRKHFSEKLGRPPGRLLLSRTLALPPPEDHRGPSYGPKYDFPHWTGPEWQRTHGSKTFFMPPVFCGPEDDGLVCTFTWSSERQIYKPPLSIVKPPLGEEPLFQETKEPVQTDSPVEQLKGLYLQGQALRAEDNIADEESESKMCRVDSLQSVASVPSACLLSKRRCQSFPCGPRLESPYFVRNVVPAFQLDRFTYVWGQPSLQGLVEIGMVCNTGEKAWSRIRLGNVGCCTVRYTWRLLPHVDHFNTGRYLASPFIFNFSEGILLPEEKLSLPVQFSPPYAGSWTEHWYLQTTPCLGPGGRGEIPLTVWGKALEADVNLQARRRLDRELEISAVLRMSERDTWDLVKFLPIRSRESILRENMPLIPDSRGEDDVRAFMRLNPGLHYHSAAMFMLLVAYRDLQQEKQMPPPLQPPPSESFVRQRENSPTKFESTGSTSSSRKRSVCRSRCSQTEQINASAAIDSFQQTRASICVSDVHREALQLDEYSDKKQEILKNINQAILAMSLKPFTPPMRHYKHIILRQALVRLFDDIDTAEWKIRRDLGLLGDPNFEQRATFSRVPEASKYRPCNPYLGSSITSTLPRSRKLSTRASVRNTSSFLSTTVASASISTETLVPALPQPTYWEQPMPHQYREKLWSVIYTRLSSTLEALLPIIVHDGYRLNPLLPAPEI